MNHLSKSPAVHRDQALRIRAVPSAERARFEAAMAMAFSADPAARWAWPDPL
ncbi:hypothetical protein [Defluviimonas salinarum]|uniref:GNAT family N-acetyltransferase n=1 Tax=Defluviimonas salinarum TaxID=2992147 RepID=A0ABT3J7M6_9RHOB|nr:hypothetical protein [Defluviimonas salinarum]MCW3783414.1 hypothetical protein [Defluviimonas salinarum]